jgi:hypothetical protein
MRRLGMRLGAALLVGAGILSGCGDTEGKRDAAQPPPPPPDDLKAKFMRPTGKPGAAGKGAFIPGAPDGLTSVLRS